MNWRKTARESKSNLSDIDTSSVPEWPENLVSEAFLRIRDERFLFDSEMPDFPRRIPWLYVKNGCFLKAALVRRRFHQWGYPKISKLFAFGEMEFHTHFSPTGKMSFKDHVAAAVRCGDEVYLMDPSICAQKPVELKDWARFLHKNSSPSDLEFSICSQYTFSHNSPSDAESEKEEVGPRDGIERDVDFFVQDFLKKEWAWAIELNLDPVEALGSSWILTQKF